MTRAALLSIALLLSACGDCPQRLTTVSVPVVSLTDAMGETREPFKSPGRAVVCLFLMTDCPVAQATAPEMARVYAEFAPRGVTFYAAYATETAEEIKDFQKAYSLPFPALLDPKLTLARLSGATRVPEAAVFSPEGRLLYRGRIDDRVVSLGLMRPLPTHHDLRLALEAVLAGKKPDPEVTEAAGCYLPEP